MEVRQFGCKFQKTFVQCTYKRPETVISRCLSEQRYNVPRASILLLFVAMNENDHVATSYQNRLCTQDNIGTDTI